MGRSAVIHPPTIPETRNQLAHPLPCIVVPSKCLPTRWTRSQNRLQSFGRLAGVVGQGAKGGALAVSNPEIWGVWTEKNGRHHVYIYIYPIPLGICLLAEFRSFVFSAGLWWCAPTTNVEEGWSHQREAMQRSYQFCFSSKPERHTCCCILQSFCNRCLWLICDHVAWLVMFTASADVQVGFQLLKADQSHILDKRSPLADTQKLSKKVANIAFWIRRSKPSKYNLWGDDNPCFASLSSYQGPKTTVPPRCGRRSIQPWWTFPSTWLGG